jgi:hypothetical protein
MIDPMKTATGATDIDLNSKGLVTASTNPGVMYVPRTQTAGEPLLFDATKALRKAALEMLLSGSMFLADIKGGYFKDPVEKRFIAALESLREALA